MRVRSRSAKKECPSAVREPHWVPGPASSLHGVVRSLSRRPPVPCSREWYMASRNDTLQNIHIPYSTVFDVIPHRLGVTAQA